MQKKLAQHTLRFVEMTGVFCKKSIDEINGWRKKADAAEEKRPAVLALLKSAGVIDQDQEKLAAQMLGNHAQTMDLLEGAVKKIAEMQQQNRQKSAMDQGSAAPDPFGAVGNGQHDPASSLTSPFVGQRTSEKKASDLALMAGLGVPSGR